MPNTSNLKDGNNISAEEKVGHLFRDLSGKMTAALSHFFGLQHLESVEDVIQETFYTALKTWPTNFPPNPQAWLFKVAKNKAINLIKRDSHIRDNLLQKYLTLHNPQELAAFIDDAFEEGIIHDSQFRLLIACVNAPVSPKSQIIFTLKTLGGFGTSEIASALIMNHEAVSKNYRRTVKSIREKGISLEDIAVDRLKVKPEMVHTVIYLLFNEGYKASSGTHLLREELCLEAIRLTKILYQAAFFNSTTEALLSLMYFNLARFQGRVGQMGELVLLKDQDRSLWDKELIKAGFHHFAASMKGAQLTSFHIEAGIASIHCLSPDYHATDWQKLLFYYDRLVEISPSPAAHLNRIVVLKMLKGPRFALQQLHENTHMQSLRKSHLYYAVKGRMLEDAGDLPAAMQNYQQALALTGNESEKNFLRKLLGN